MNTSTLLQSQLLATKFYIPVTAGRLISRPRLNALLNEGLNRSFTLVSAPAGSGKTTLLSTWAHSLPACDLRLCWVSLDEEDNEPRLFWSYVLTALQKHDPERFEPLLMHLQSQPPLSLQALLTALINVLAEGTDHFVLVLDDYQVITEEQVHTTLAYVIEHLPAQLRLILSTRADPPLPLPLLRARQQALEVRTAQLCCTAEEVKTFFREVIGIQLPGKAIEQVTTRTEGWLVGLQLLGLSLPDRVHPEQLLQEMSGDQRYILDYLTEVVLRQQPPEVQTFLLSTCILERLTAPLCDAVLQQTGSQHLLQQLEQANLFVVSLDSKREWYRYHTLFAEALHYQLEQTQPDLMLTLHHRASLWYAQHGQTTEAILHALKAQEWQWAAHLIEQKSLPVMSLVWGASQYALLRLQDWLQLLPVDIISSRPHLCLACTQLLWLVTPHPVLEAWLDAAQAQLSTSLHTQTHEDVSNLVSKTQQEQENLLGELITWHALLRCFQGHGQATLQLCQQASTLLSPQNALMHAYLTSLQFEVAYVSDINDATTAVKLELQASALAWKAHLEALALLYMGVAIRTMIGTGQLHEAQRLSYQAILVATKPSAPPLADVGWPKLFEADILREWNDLDAALSVVREGISLCQQVESISLLMYLLSGYAMLLRIYLSYGDLDAAKAAFQQVEQIGSRMNQPSYLYLCSYFTIVDQIRLWLACGELDRATRWVAERGMREQYGTPFASEREEVACIRVHLAQANSILALERLEPVLQRATQGQRWGHVIEIQLLRTLAYQMCHQEMQALATLSEAVRLAEPQGYIRSFVDEGASMESLLCKLREQERKHGPTPYLDRILAAFQQESMGQGHTEEHTTVQALPEPLSEREREVLQLLARGASNQEIAQELVIVVDTVKRHVSHIFAKLGVSNRIQAIRQAQERDLLSEQP